VVGNAGIGAKKFYFGSTDSVWSDSFRRLWAEYNIRISKEKSEKSALARFHYKKILFTLI